MSRRFKTFALRALRAGGVAHLVGSSRWRSRRLLILCYHGFALRDEAQWDPGLFVTAAHLDQRLALLRRLGCTVLPLHEGVARLAAGELPPRAVTLTVDDGNYDFLARGLPVLERHRAHATVYVASYHVQDQRPVFNVMASYLLWRAGRNRRDMIRLGTDELPVGTPAVARDSAARLRARAHTESWSADDKHALLGELAAAAGEDWEALLSLRLLGLMTPAELASLPDQHVDVQLHTHRHRVPRDQSGFLREITDNRTALAAAGRDPSRLVHFCYPSGEHRPEFLPWLAEAGVRTATTCVPGLAGPTTDPLLLPRFIDTGLTDATEFEAWCTGLRGILRRPSRQFSRD